MRVWLLTILLLLPMMGATSIAESEYVMPLKLKVGVKPRGLVPEMNLGIQVVCSIFEHYKYDCVITSMHDGVHGPNSLHSRDGLCRAVDFRTKHVSSTTKDLLLGEIRDALTTDYDVIFEHSGEANEHLHLEYDQKVQI